MNTPSISRFGPHLKPTTEATKTTTAPEPNDGLRKELMAAIRRKISKGRTTARPKPPRPTTERPHRLRPFRQNTRPPTTPRQVQRTTSASTRLLHFGDEDEVSNSVVSTQTPFFRPIPVSPGQQGGYSISKKMFCPILQSQTNGTDPILDLLGQ